MFSKKNKIESKIMNEQKTENANTDALLSKEKSQPADLKKNDDPIAAVKQSDFEKVNAELAEAKDKYLRIVAEFDNARKRFERDRAEFVKYANEGLIAEFLSILDNLQRAVDAAKTNHQNYSAFLKGVEIVMSHIDDLLKKNNVKPIEAIGKPFDPHAHEILAMEETDEKNDGIVLDELQKGYYLGDKVVRTAKVKVGQAKQDNFNKKDE